MIYGILAIHWVADFILQTDNMARGKSKELKWLSYHILAYTAPFLIFGVKYALVNGASHFIIDYFSSRASSYLVSRNRVHDFFVVVGFDQLLHVSLLIATMPLVDPIWR